MECFQAVNTLIDIGEEIISKKKLGFPGTYGEIFEILSRNGYMTKEEEKIGKRLIFLRNLIAHEYYKITEEEIREMATLLLKISDFVERTN